MYVCPTNSHHTLCDMIAQHDGTIQGVAIAIFCFRPDKTMQFTFKQRVYLCLVRLLVTLNYINGILFG